MYHFYNAWILHMYAQHQIQSPIYFLIYRNMTDYDWNIMSRKIQNGYPAIFCTDKVFVLVITPMTDMLSRNQDVW